VATCDDHPDEPSQEAVDLGQAGGHLGRAGQVDERREGVVGDELHKKLLVSSRSLEEGGRVGWTYLLVGAHCRNLLDVVGPAKQVAVTAVGCRVWPAKWLQNEYMLDLL